MATGPFIWLISNKFSDICPDSHQYLYHIARRYLRKKKCYSNYQRSRDVSTKEITSGIKRQLFGDVQVQRRDYWNVQLGAEEQKKNVTRRCWVREVGWI